MHELLNSDTVYDLMPYLPVFLAVFALVGGCVGTFFVRRGIAKREASTHTMSEAEYIRFNDKRTGNEL